MMMMKMMMMMMMMMMMIVLAKLQSLSYHSRLSHMYHGRLLNAVDDEVMYGMTLDILDVYLPLVHQI